MNYEFVRNKHYNDFNSFVQEEKTHISEQLMAGLSLYEALRALSSLYRNITD